MAEFAVKLYYSSFCEYQIEAKDIEEAILRARELPIDEEQIIQNLEVWSNADEAEYCSN